MMLFVGEGATEDDDSAEKNAQVIKLRVDDKTATGNVTTANIDNKTDVDSIVDTVGNDKTFANDKTNEDGSSDFQAMKIGDKIKLDFVDMTLDKLSVAEEIFPADTSGFYSYYENISGEKYIYLKGKIQNISGNGYSVKDMVSEVVFDNKYTYTCYVIANDGGNDFYSDYVNSMTGVTYYIYASVPDEVISNYSSCTFFFGFEDKFNGSYYDSFSKCPYLYQLSAKKISGGSLLEKVIIFITNIRFIAEFFGLFAGKCER